MSSNFGLEFGDLLVLACVFVSDKPDDSAEVKAKMRCAYREFYDTITVDLFLFCVVQFHLEDG